MRAKTRAMSPAVVTVARAGPAKSIGSSVIQPQMMLSATIVQVIMQVWMPNQSTAVYAM